MKLYSLIIVILVLVLSGFGQSAKPKSVEDLENQIQTFRDKDQYRVGFNAYENFTLVMFGGFDMLGSAKLVSRPVSSQFAGTQSNQSFLFMSVYFSFDGNRLRKDVKEYGIYLVCSGEICKDISGSNLVADADDKSIDFGKGGTNKRLIPAPETQIIDFKTSKEALIQIGKAKKVVIKAGKLARTLKPEQVEVFVNIAALGDLSKRG